MKTVRGTLCFAALLTGFLTTPARASRGDPISCVT